MTDAKPIPDDDDGPEPPEVAELKALVEQYRQRFGKDPNWWALHTSGDDDHAHQLREAIRTGQPIELNLPPGWDA